MPAFASGRASVFTCGAGRASLSCDGCDHVLCTACAVGPTSELDFCPACFNPAFEYWKSISVIPRSRPDRRQAFRLWARANAAKFLELSKPRTKKSLQEVTGGVDAPAHVDPMTPPSGESE